MSKTSKLGPKKNAKKELSLKNFASFVFIMAIILFACTFGLIHLILPEEFALMLFLLLVQTVIQQLFPLYYILSLHKLKDYFLRSLKEYLKILLHYTLYCFPYCLVTIIVDSL